MVQGTENSVELNYLNSLTEYQVAVFAIYRSSASEALRGSATTCKFEVWNVITEDCSTVYLLSNFLTSYISGTFVKSQEKQELLLISVFHLSAAAVSRNVFTNILERQTNT